jgi:hypothetical protein
MNKIRNEWYAKSFSARKIGIYILGSSGIEMCLKAEIACKKERKGNHSYMECEVFCIK